MTSIVLEMLGFEYLSYTCTYLWLKYNSAFNQTTLKIMFYIQPFKGYTKSRRFHCLCIIFYKVIG